MEKAAILFLCMDEQTTGQLFQQMNDDEIKRVGSALLRLEKIPAIHIQNVIDEFTKGVLQDQAAPTPQAAIAAEDIQLNGRHVAEKLLSKSLPRNRGREILQSIWSPQTEDTSDRRDFGDLINEYSGEDLYKLLKEEHPQIIAVALYFAKRSVAKDVLGRVTPEMRIDLMTRMAKLQKLSETMLEQLSLFVQSKMRERQQRKASGQTAEVEEEVKQEILDVQGFDETLMLLKSMPWDEAVAMVEQIRSADAELGALLEKRMLTIEDLERANDRGMREMIGKLSADDMKIALKNAPEEVQNKFFNNMSERARMILKEDMDVMPPVKVEEVEAAQEKIMAAAKELMQQQKLQFEAISDDE